MANLSSAFLRLSLELSAFEDSSSFFLKQMNMGHFDNTAKYAKIPHGCKSLTMPAIPYKINPFIVRVMRKPGVRLLVSWGHFLLCP